MTAGLREHALASIDEDDREVRRRRGGDHVAGVLLVPGGVGHDELAVLRRGEPIGDVDGDALHRSAINPSTRRAKSRSPPRVPSFLESTSSVARWSSKELRLVEQPADQVDLPSSTEPHVVKRSRVRFRCASISGSERSVDGPTDLRSNLPVSLLHGAGSVEIDDPALPLRDPGPQQLADDRRQRRRLALDRAGERVAPQRAESHRAQTRALVGAERQAIVVHHDEAAVALDHRTLGREVQRHDRDVLQVDVLPDVDLGPVGEREHPDGLALVLAGVVEAPQLGPLIARIPAMVRRAEGEAPFLGPALLLVAPGAADRGVEAVGVERELQRLGLHHVGVDLRSVGDGADPLPETVVVHEHDELHADHLAVASRNSYMARNFHVVSMWSSGNGGGEGKKAFRARWSITELSLPTEYISTGRSHSAATSRKMRMLSPSRRRR